MHPSNIYSHCQRHSNHKHQNPASLDPSAQMKNHENIQIDLSFIEMELQFVKFVKSKNFCCKIYKIIYLQIQTSFCMQINNTDFDSIENSREFNKC